MFSIFIYNILYYIIYNIIFMFFPLMAKLNFQADYILNVYI